MWLNMFGKIILQNNCFVWMIINIVLLSSDGLLGLGVLGGALLVGGALAAGAVALAGMGIAKLAKK